MAKVISLRMHSVCCKSAHPRGQALFLELRPRLKKGNIQFLPRFSLFSPYLLSFPVQHIVYDPAISFINFVTRELNIYVCYGAAIRMAERLTDGIS